jgi:hypothetical protein
VDQKPSIGRIVHYVLGKGDVKSIEAYRSEQHVEGGMMEEGQIVPMIITKVLNGGPAVNGQAYLDGPDILWVRSALQGDGPRNWMWPPRVQ